MKSHTIFKNLKRRTVVRPFFSHFNYFFSSESSVFLLRQWVLLNRFLLVFFFFCFFCSGFVHSSACFLQMFHEGFGSRFIFLFSGRGVFEYFFASSRADFTSSMSDCSIFPSASFRVFLLGKFRHRDGFSLQWFLVFLVCFGVDFCFFSHFFFNFFL